MANVTMKPVYYEGDDFSSTFDKLLSQYNLSCYRVNEFTGIDQGYLSRLRNGQKTDPSPRILFLISLAFMHYIPNLKIADIEKLFHSAGRYL